MAWLQGEGSIGAYLDNLFVEVRVVHVENGCFDVPGSWETLDLNENVVGSALIQNSQDFILL
jgi:hypothetical protein